VLPVGAAQADHHVEGEAVEEGAQPGGEAVGVYGLELAVRMRHRVRRRPS
jgi:hypothetical protein